MPTENQIEYIKINKDHIKEPIAIIGSREYDFDQRNFIKELNIMGFSNIIGIDIKKGKGVYVVTDICDFSSSFVKNHNRYFCTIICMQMLYSVVNPFNAAKSIQSLMSKNGILIFSDIFTHRVNRIPKDYWRFTYDAHKLIFSDLSFIDAKSRIGITRINKLVDFKYPIPEVNKYYRVDGESYISYIFRRLYAKCFRTSLLSLNRLMPETSIFSIAKKINEKT